MTNLLKSRSWLLILITLIAASACDTPTESAVTPPAASPAAPDAVSTEPPEATSQPISATPTRQPEPTTAIRDVTYNGPFELTSVETSGGRCEQLSPLQLPHEGLLPVSYIPTRLCFNGEIGLMEIEDRLYVVLSSGVAGAFTITDVTDPTAPEVVGAWGWRPRTYTSDVKPFRQGDRWYLALAMEASAADGVPCGIAIVEVSDPQTPQLVGLYNGNVVASDAPWCDVHTTQVDVDENGDGNFIMVTSDDTTDLRVIDIRDLDNIHEVNAYPHPVPSFYAPGFPSTFVHDSTIVGDRVYISYWDGGVMIVDKHKLEAGAPPEEVVLNPANSIDPAGFEVHHSYPTLDGNFLFIEDEVNFAPPFSQLRLFDIRDLSQPDELLRITIDDPLSSPHNLLIEDDLLFVGWYKNGIRIYRFDLSDPADPIVEPVAFQAVRDEEPDTGAFNFRDIFDGIYGVRVHECEIEGRTTTCVYASDLTLGLIILELDLE